MSAFEIIFWIACAFTVGIVGGYIIGRARGRADQGELFGRSLWDQEGLDAISEEHDFRYHGADAYPGVDEVKLAEQTEHEEDVTIAELAEPVPDPEAWREVEPDPEPWNEVEHFRQSAEANGYRSARSVEEAERLFRAQIRAELIGATEPEPERTGNDGDDGQVAFDVPVEGEYDPPDVIEWRAKFTPREDGAYDLSVEDGETGEDECLPIDRRDRRDRATDSSPSSSESPESANDAIESPSEPSFSVPTSSLGVTVRRGR